MYRKCRFSDYRVPLMLTVLTSRDYYEGIDFESLERVHRVMNSIAKSICPKELDYDMKYGEAVISTVSPKEKFCDIEKIPFHHIRTHGSGVFEIHEEMLRFLFELCYCKVEYDDTQNSNFVFISQFYKNIIPLMQKYFRPDIISSYQRKYFSFVSSSELISFIDGIL